MWLDLRALQIIKRNHFTFYFEQKLATFSYRINIDWWQLWCWRKACEQNNLSIQERFQKETKIICANFKKKKFGSKEFWRVELHVKSKNNLHDLNWASRCCITTKYPSQKDWRKSVHLTYSTTINIAILKATKIG
jgi:hypothetical protein